MTQASKTIEQQEAIGFHTPIDGIIDLVATKVGGSKSKEVERFLKFAFVGTLGAVVDLGVLNLLMFTLLPPIEGTYNAISAATISFIAAVVHNFLWNRYWTYPDSRSRSLRRQLVLFTVVSFTGWLGRTIWITIAKGFMTDFAESLVHTYNLPMSDIRAAQLGVTFAVFIGIFVVMIWNFFVNRYWTFNDVE